MSFIGIIFERSLTMEAHVPRLHHENLDVYKASINFLILANNLIDKIPKGNKVIVDQFKRASLSVPLNIAEGYGKKSIHEKMRFYYIARGSAHECGAALDACRILKFVDDQKYKEGKELLHRIVSMLVKMNK
jgi:four helix bundle protein